eukprot:RCo014774
MGNICVAHSTAVSGKGPAISYHETDSTASEDVPIGAVASAISAPPSRNPSRCPPDPPPSRTLPTTRLHCIVTNMFKAPPQPEAGPGSTHLNEIPMIMLPTPPTARPGHPHEGSDPNHLGSDGTDRTRNSLSPTSHGSSSRVLSARLSSRRAKKSVAAYQHILDEVRAGLVPVAEKPVDPRWRTLLPFQPRCLRHQVLTVNKDCTQVEGAIAFVDISGFSALANALANQGAKGAMLMSKYINDYLARLIEVVYASGGDIVAFAGDAFLALWEYSPTRDTQK